MEHLPTGVTLFYSGSDTGVVIGGREGFVFISMFLDQHLSYVHVTGRWCCCSGA
ncbi:hypothetical protein ANAPH1_01032 [Anaplasma phagocytophilum]|nr:hypothetical protein ANAPH1_01032 [Anaplasma phagocytophilum]